MMNIKNLSVLIQWMFTYESNGREHYTYFPIEYPTRDPVALVSFKGQTNEPVWIKVIDKAKFIDGYVQLTI